MYKYKMKSYCWKCRKDTENINPKVSKTSHGRTMILSKCEVCGSKKSRFTRKQEAKGLLSNLGITTPLNIITGCYSALKCNFVEWNSIERSSAESYG